ncbi:MAG: ABC transporter ATP-binding protein [Mycobacteriales bacterium]
MATQPHALEAILLTKSYGRTRGIVNVDLRAERGEVLGLVGANGAGKTTLMRTLLDFIRPTSGSISAFGHDSVRESVAVRRLCAYLPGELVIPPRLTGRQALERFSFGRPPLDRARVANLAERLNVDLSRRFGDLSKGNKQKVGLLLAFAPRVELLVLDEPTSGLDPLLQREFASLLRDVVAEGTAVVLSSHVMSEVEHVASRVALMREGRVAAVDALTSITARARRRGRVVLQRDGDLAGLLSALATTSGVSDVVREAGSVLFACTGDMDALTKTLSRFALHSLDVAHADLEDAFFSAYDGPDNSRGGS